ncbi:MAG: YciI family protein [Flavobacterium sp.]
MKKSISLFLIALVSLTAKAQETKTNPKYDEKLAVKVGADEYGMKNYIFVILKSGENKSTDKEFKGKCFAGHLENIKRLAASKQLVVAGPFGNNDKDFRGLFILNVATTEEAEKLLSTDPAIKEGFLKPELYPWYGSAALSEYLDASDKVWKKGF